MSFVYVPAVVIVAHYFDENRAIATAMAVGGTGSYSSFPRAFGFCIRLSAAGLGNAVVAQLIHILNDHYSDWRQTTMFLSGVMFMIVGFGALFRPLEFSFRRKTNKPGQKASLDRRLPPSCMTSTEKLQRFIQEMDEQCAMRQAQHSLSISASQHDTENDDLFDSYSADDIRELEDEFNETSTMKIPPSRFRYLLNGPAVAGDKYGSAHRLSRFYSLPPEQQEKQLLQVYYQPISQKDIFYRGNVPVKSSNVTQSSCPDLIQAYVYEESATTVSDDDDTDSTRSQHHRLVFYRKGLSFWNTFRRMLGLHLFRDYRYVIFFVSQFLFYLFYDLIYLFPGEFPFVRSCRKECASRAFSRLW